MTTSTTTPQIDDRTSADIIWATIQDLHSQEQVCTRELLHELTGLKMPIIDDHVSRLIDDGRLRRLRAGVFAMLITRPEPEAFSITELPEGLVIIEVGDQQLRTNEAMARRIARSLMGYAVQFSNLQNQHDMGAILTDYTVRHRSQANEIQELRKVVQQLQKRLQDGDAGQMSLIG
ncbi:hypothetical protein [Delftia deserti]|uniref:Transcriptional regulator n=1 Tax=Delftia deserti TaxID=1651218 RepID=A0ABW5F0F4_9BURK